MQLQCNSMPGRATYAKTCTTYTAVTTSWPLKHLILFMYCGLPLNRFHTEQGHCGACRRKWRLTDWSVSLRRDSDDVPHYWILSSDKAEWRLVPAILCRWRCCFLDDQLWFMTRIREECLRALGLYPFHFLLHIFNQGRSCIILFCTCKLSGRSEAKAENLWDGSSDIDMWNNKKRQKTECGHTERTSDGKRYQWNVTEYRHTNWSTVGMWLAWKRTDIQISWCTGTHMDDSLEGDQGKRGWTTLQKIVKSWT